MPNALIVSRPELRSNFLAPIESHFNKVFNAFCKDFFDDSLEPIDVNNASYPKLDVVVTGDSFIANFSVPGVDKDALSIEQEKDTIRVSGEMSKEYKHDKGNVYVSELHKSRFSRVIRLPKEVDSTRQPKAQLKNGILTLTWDIRKAETPPPPKLIKIE